MTTPREYQKEDILATINEFNGRALLALEMGLGKTLEALWFLRKKPNALPALVICPANAKWVWQEQAAKHVKLKSTVLSGQTPYTSLLTASPVTIINYDILPYWLKKLKQTRYRTLICDETQYIKAFKANRTRATISVAKHMEYVLCLSGTPLLNRPDELYNALSIIRPDIWNNRLAYRWRYCNPKYKPWGWDYSGATNLDELHKRLVDTCMVRRTKTAVLHQLPRKIRMIVRMPLSHPNEYVRAERDFIAWLKEKSPKRAKRATKAIELTKMNYLQQLAALLKLKAVYEWVDDFLEGSDSKIILFARHRKVIDKLERRYKRIAVRISGGTDAARKHQICKMFQTDRHIRILIGQIQAAGTAITLTAADTVAFVELSPTPAVLMQAEDRAHRIGQTQQVFVYYLIARNTVEDDLCRLVQKKARIIEHVLDGTATTNLNIYDTLKRCLQDRRMT